VGGDDFVFLLRSLDWVLRLTAILEELPVSLLNFHTGEHRAAGGFDGADRDGGYRRFPLLGASIGAVEVDGGQPTTAERVLESLREMKALAKSREGSSCVLASFGRAVDLTRGAEILRPVDRLAARRVDGEGDPHLLKSGGHDVGAMVGARQPAGDDLASGSDTAGDVLTHHAPAVAGAARALPGSAAVAAGMTEEVVHGHIPRMSARGLGQGRRKR